MSDDPSPEERGRALLAQAFKQCSIPERKNVQATARFAGAEVYWQNPNGDIQIVFAYVHMLSGRVTCSISLRGLAKLAAEGFADDSDALDALVDAIKYLESTISVLLPMTGHKLLRRVFNLNVRSRTSKDQQKGWEAILEQLMPAYSDGRDAMGKRLAGERDWRGGSKARLKEDQRRSLHTQYDTLHEVARAAKKDYNVTLKQFAKSRAAKGYSHREWRDYWRKHVSENYPAELLKDFLELFARTDSPSASEVAYVKLSKHTSHKRSYLPQLVADSRKAAKVSTIKDRN